MRRLVGVVRVRFSSGCSHVQQFRTELRTLLSQGSLASLTHLCDRDDVLHFVRQQNPLCLHVCRAPHFAVNKVVCLEFEPLDEARLLLLLIVVLVPSEELRRAKRDCAHDQ